MTYLLLLLPVLLWGLHRLQVTRVDWRQVFCRHDEVLDVQPHVLRLRCVTCGKETAGWQC